MVQEDMSFLYAVKDKQKYCQVVQNTALLPPNEIKKCLYLDIDLALVSRKNIVGDTTGLTKFYVTGSSGTSHFIKCRPHLRGFLTEMAKFFTLIIFTSSDSLYGNSIVENGMYGVPFKRILTRDDCVIGPGGRVKPMNHIYQKDEEIQKNCLLFEDNPLYVADEKFHNNVFTVPAFENASDSFLKDVQGILKEIALADNVSEKMAELKWKWLEAGAISKGAPPEEWF